MEDRLVWEEEFRLREYEQKPNKRAAKAMLYAMAVILFNWAANELNVFRVDKMLMREGSLIAFIILLVPQILAANERIVRRRVTKYVMIVCALLATLTVNVLMSFHAALCLILPLLLAMQYRSRRIGMTAFVGSVLVTLAAPVASYLIGAWDTLFLRVLLQLAGFDSALLPAPLFSRISSVGQIILYVALPEELMIAVTGLVTLTVIRTGQKSLEGEVGIRRGNERILRTQSGIIDGMATIIESRDGGTGAHVANTRFYVSVILDYMLENGLFRDTVDREFAELVTCASILHDIGKVSIPDAILNKPGKFTPEEFEIMKGHTVSGDRMVDRVFGDNADPAMLRILHNVVGTHHERYDGGGYPVGLQGEQIPLEGRVMAIADVFDALISQRVYKAPYSVDEAYRILESESGTHFDPEIVRIFTAVRPVVERYALRLTRGAARGGSSAGGDAEQTE